MPISQPFAVRSRPTMTKTMSVKSAKAPTSHGMSDTMPSGMGSTPSVTTLAPVTVKNSARSVRTPVAHMPKRDRKPRNIRLFSLPFGASGSSGGSGACDGSSRVRMMM